MCQKQVSWAGTSDYIQPYLWGVITCPSHWHLPRTHISSIDINTIDLPPTLNHLLSELNTLWPKQNGCHLRGDTFKRIFFNENVIISIEISLKFVAKGPTSNIPALVEIMTWRRPGDKPLCQPMLVRLPTHICVTGPQRVNVRLSDDTRYRCFSYVTLPHIYFEATLGKWNSHGILWFKRQVNVNVWPSVTGPVCLRPELVISVHGMCQAINRQSIDHTDILVLNIRDRLQTVKQSMFLPYLLYPHYSDDIMRAMASQITSLAIVY